MVTTGYSRIHVAKYAYADGKVTYSGCIELARARGMETDIETTDENNFYANNQVAETEPARFKSGKAKITVDGLNGEEEAFILGIEESTVTVGEKEVPVVKFGNKMTPPYLGIGSVKRMQLNGVESFRPVIFCRAKFAIPPDAAETQEEDISWQDQELEATLTRDESSEKNWKMIPKTNYATEDEAVEFIRAFLGGVATSTSANNTSA